MGKSATWRRDTDLKQMLKWMLEIGLNVVVVGNGVYSALSIRFTTSFWPVRTSLTTYSSLIVHYKCNASEIPLHFITTNKIHFLIYLLLSLNYVASKYSNEKK